MEPAAQDSAGWRRVICGMCSTEDDTAFVKTVLSVSCVRNTAFAASLAVKSTKDRISKRQLLYSPEDQEVSRD